MQNYNKEDVSALLDLVEEKLPMGAMGWDAVTSSYNNDYAANTDPPRNHRDRVSLKAKFDEKHKVRAEGWDLK